jgi:DNA-binding transcriptional ArsR family regulator
MIYEQISPAAATPKRSDPKAGALEPAELKPASLKRRAGEAELFLRSLASRHRLVILCSLLDGECAVGALVKRLGLTQSNLSRHLAMLREEGLVATRREGTTIYYRIGSERVRPILAELYRLFCVETKKA